MSDRGRVLLVGITLPKIGGISLTIDKLQHNRILQESFQVEVCNPYAPEAGLLDRILSRLFHYPQKSQSNLSLLKSSISEFNPDLIHFFSSAFSGFWTNRHLTGYVHRMGIPYLLNMRGGGFIKFYQNCTQREKRRILDTLLRADLLLVQSDEWAEYYGSLHPEIRIAVLPNYVLIPDASEFVGVARKQAILFLGHLKVGKGVKLLLNVWRELQPEFPGWELWLAGPDREQFTAVVKADEFFRNSVRLHGVVQGEQKAALLKQASIFVLPSMAEGLPNSMLEAMAYKIPVIVTPVGAVPGIITDSENGLLVEVGNQQQLKTAIAGLAGSAEERKRLGEAGYESAQTSHSEQLFTQELIGLYQELLNAAAS
jgi:glycosyltransferase involved in cell wall biosynthesis